MVNGLFRSAYVMVKTALDNPYISYIFIPVNANKFLLIPMESEYSQCFASLGWDISGQL